MKKLIQFSIVVILLFVLLQAMVGGAFSAAGNALVNGTQLHSVPPASVQSALVITCWDGRMVNCYTPNVGWNS